jgi:nucleotide-binding universal stress UspA family protein
MFSIILTGTDGSDSGDRAVTFAKELARDQKSRLIVVHVDELVPGHGGAHHIQAMEPELKTKIADQVTQARSEGLDVEFETYQVGPSSPAHAIADAAAKSGADLIVLGSVGSGPAQGPPPGERRTSVAADRTLPRAHHPHQEALIPSATTGPNVSRSPRTSNRSGRPVDTAWLHMEIPPI